MQAEFKKTAMCDGFPAYSGSAPPGTCAAWLECCVISTFCLNSLQAASPSRQRAHPPQKTCWQTAKRCLVLREFDNYYKQLQNNYKHMQTHYTTTTKQLQNNYKHMQTQ